MRIVKDKEMNKISILVLVSIIFAIEANVKVEGMMCGVSCVNTVKTKTMALNGVNSCNVNFEKGLLTINYDETKITDNEIISQLGDTTPYKFSTMASNINKCSSPCSKQCCAKQEKQSFFKRFLNWF